MLFLKIYMRVNLSGYNRAVTKQMLDIGYIYIFFYENYFTMILSNTK